MLSNINKKGQLFVDVQQINVPDAMTRIRQKIYEKQKNEVNKKLKIADVMEK